MIKYEVISTVGGGASVASDRPQDPSAPTSGPPAQRRGGTRAGAGRPKVYDRLVRVTISLPASYWGALTRLGDGNVSDAVRQLIEDAGLAR